MSEGIIIALISAGVAIAIALVGIITLRATARSNKELAIIAANNSRDLALIAAGQIKIDDKVEKYHKEVDGKMTLLLETTGAAEKAKGVKQGKETNQAETDAKPQEKK